MLRVPRSSAISRRSNRLARVRRAVALVVLEQFLALGRGQRQPRRDLVRQLGGIRGQLAAGRPARQAQQDVVVDAEQFAGAHVLPARQIAVGLVEELDLGAQVGLAVGQQRPNGNRRLPTHNRSAVPSSAVSISRISASVPTASTSGRAAGVCRWAASVPLRSDTTPKRCAGAPPGGDPAMSENMSR